MVKLADLGDLLTATPALRALRLRFPHAEITALVSDHTACLLEGNDAVDHVLAFPKARFDEVGRALQPSALATGIELARRLHTARFDAAVLLHHLTTRWGLVKYRALLSAARVPVRAGLDNGAGAFLTHRAEDLGFGARHEVDYWLAVVEQLGARHPAPALELPLRAEECALADEGLARLGVGGRPIVALHAGSGAFSLARRWPAERFAAVGDALAAEGLDVLLVAGPDERGLADEVRARMRAPAVALEGLASPRVLAATLRRCALFVGNDSGIMHCATAVGVPVVAVFGPSNHRAWGPYPVHRHRVVRLDLPCSPCFYTGFGLGTPEGCSPRPCLTTLEPSTVVRVARDLLAGAPTSGRRA